MSRPRQLGYALGNAGFGITGQIVVGIGIFFYLPPGDPRLGLEPQVSTQVFWGFLTAYGLARLLGGAADSLADPLVGHLSDRSRSALGRRRVFMIAGLFPMALLPVWLFWPPGAPGSLANFVFLTLLLVLYYVSFTVYVAPYLALMPEIARTREERVDLSRLFALVGFPVIAFFGPAWQAGVEGVRNLGLSGPDAVRAVVVLSSLVALALCAAPILAVDERRLGRMAPSNLALGQAVSTTLRNRPFLIYLVAQILFILGINMIGPLGPYLAIVVLGRDLGFAALIGMIPVLPAILGFLLVQRIVEWLGPGRTIAVTVAVFGLLLSALGMLEPDVPGGPADARNLAILIGVMAGLGPAIAVFIVLPNVIIAELIDLDAARTGAQRSAMYFGAQGLFTKWSFAGSAALLGFLFSEFGNAPERPDGVLLAGPVAGVLCLLSAGVYGLYPERAVLAEIRSRATEPA